MDTDALNEPHYPGQSHPGERSRLLGSTCVRGAAVRGWAPLVTGFSPRNSLAVPSWLPALLQLVWMKPRPCGAWLRMVSHQHLLWPGKGESGQEKRDSTLPPVLIPRPLPHQFLPTSYVFCGICSLAWFDGTCTKSISNLFERPPKSSSSETLLAVSSVVNCLKIRCWFLQWLPLAILHLLVFPLIFACKNWFESYHYPLSHILIILLLLPQHFLFALKQLQPPPLCPEPPDFCALLPPT